MLHQKLERIETSFIVLFCHGCCITFLINSSITSRRALCVRAIGLTLFSSEKHLEKSKIFVTITSLISITFSKRRVNTSFWVSAQSIAINWSYRCSLSLCRLAVVINGVASFERIDTHVMVRFKGRFCFVAN